ncbi:hypothetical protein AGLY_001966 [Aphis glycines]|uniref:Uncharacterized protein n=1 Tax=Aphis glycines TaxID=307491 RepID=A0A6G0U6D1_APHGL|nr:hypothetical protein AGLY_001966 [Aphis glycines]
MLSDNRVDNAFVLVLIRLSKIIFLLLNLIKGMLIRQRQHMWVWRPLINTKINKLKAELTIFINFGFHKKFKLKMNFLLIGQHSTSFIMIFLLLTSIMYQEYSLCYWKLPLKPVTKFELRGNAVTPSNISASYGTTVSTVCKSEFGTLWSTNSSHFFNKRIFSFLSSVYDTLFTWTANRSCKVVAAALLLLAFVDNNNRSETPERLNTLPAITVAVTEASKNLNLMYYCRFVIINCIHIVNP